MRRKSLRKIDALYDLSYHLVEMEWLNGLVSAQSLFGQTAPLEVEVGCGKGLYLAQAAQAHPTHLFLGVEISLRYAKYSALRLLKTGVRNARVIHGDAQRFFHDHLPDQAVCAVHVYFPDPWWKKRHRKRRVLNSVFLRSVERVLQPGGRLHFWTDVEEYFQTTLQRITQETSLQGPFTPPESPQAYRTHFERRTLLQGLPVYRAEFVRP